MSGSAIADRFGGVFPAEASAAPTAAGQQRDAADEAPRPADAFPRTRRPLPWFLAAFLAMVFLVPIDATELKVHLPVDSHPDRLAVVVLMLAWLVFGGDQRAFLRTRRSKLFVTAACIFLAIAVASLLLDAPRIINVDEFSLSEKKFALLGSYLVVAWFALTALRFEDLRGFGSFIIGLAVIASIGMLVERRTGTNYFYEWSRTVLGPIAEVAKSPTNIHPSPATEGRVIVVGPTVQGLAATAMLVMAMPFALVRFLDATSRRTWWLNAAAFAVMMAGAVATDKKTALLVPLAVVLYVAWYRRRQVLRLAPLGLLVLAAAVHFADPGSLGTLTNVNAQVRTGSTEHRANDLKDVTPDVTTHPLFGRGYGALNSDQPGNFRINDNQLIDELWEVGVVGLLAFVWMILSPVVLARSAIRTRGPTISSLALAASGGCIAFLVVCALLDSMGFTEAPYMFFVIAALTTIAAAGPEGNVEPAIAATRKRVAGRGRPIAAT
jgi:hypothetical protein